MMRTTSWRNARDVTFYVLLFFFGFVVIWLFLVAKVRAEGEKVPRLVTDVEIHRLEARWGLDLFAVPMIAMVTAVLQRKKRIGHLVLAIGISLGVAIGMAYFPAAIMGGHIRWPVSSTYFDSSGFLDYALTYATGVVVMLFFVNRIAARMMFSSGAAMPA
jgi:Terpene cyclase DEP1